MSRSGTDISDERLVAEYRQGSEEAFNLLFGRYSRKIHGYVLGLVRDADHADEVTQQVFVKLSQKPEKFRPTGSFSSWLHRVARNTALDLMKGRRPMQSLEDALGREQGEPRGPALEGTLCDPPDDPLGPDAIQGLVARAVGRLDGVRREALVLREYSELSYREISEITGRTLTNVKQDIYQARRSLREELAPRLGRVTDE